MKKTTRFIPFLILLFVLVTTIPACNGESSEATAPAGSGDDGAALNLASDTDTPGSAEEASPPDGTKLTAKTVILTVDSDPVYWPEFLFWMKYLAKYYKAAIGVEEITDWDTDQNGMHLRDFFLTTAVGYACKDRAIEAKARELGVDLTEKDIAEMEERRTKNIQIYGSVSEYRHIVSSMYVSEEVFNYLSKMDYLGNHLFEHLYGDNGKDFSDTDISAYIQDGGFMCAKYIFLSNTDTDGNDIDAEERSENETLLKDLLGQLDASDRAPSLFTELMNKFGQDKTMARYPHGRLLASGSKGKAFETACLKLKKNEYSNVVTDDDGCYIILRMPIFPAMTADSSGNSLRYRAAYDTFKKEVEEWSAKMKVEYRDEYYSIDVEGIL